MSQTLRRSYGLAAESFLVRDGDGLSRKNRVAPEAMTKLLAAAAARNDAAVLLESLPISGEYGSLKDRLAAAPYRGRVLAKTGYISGVSCLSGYVLGRAGRPDVAFAILINDVPRKRVRQAKRLHDDICRLLVDSLNGG